jgi:hypothetical protein
VKEATRSALDWLAEVPGRRAAHAAKLFGVQQSTVSRAAERELGKHVCPTCGSVVYEKLEDLV